MALQILELCETLRGTDAGTVRALLVSGHGVAFSAGRDLKESARHNQGSESINQRDSFGWSADAAHANEYFKHTHTHSHSHTHTHTLTLSTHTHTRWRGG